MMGPFNHPTMRLALQGCLMEEFCMCFIAEYPTIMTIPFPQ